MGRSISFDAAVHAGTGWLILDDARLLFEHFFPALRYCVGGLQLFGELEEGAVVAVFAGPEASIEFLQFEVFAGFAEECEAFAGAGFDESGDHQAVDQLGGAFAFADLLAELVGVFVAVLLAEPAAATGEDSADEREVFDFVAGDGGHGGDPVFGRAGLWPAVDELECVAGGFFLEMGVIVQKLKRIAEGLAGPGCGGFVFEWEVGLSHDVWHPTMAG